MRPVAACLTACCRAWTKATVSATEWSDGVTTKIGSALITSAWVEVLLLAFAVFSAAKAASVNAAAVLRGTGSNSAAPSVTLASRSCSVSKKR